MSDFWLYVTLGLEHVLDWTAYDHVLFLIVLSASYTFSSWKRLVLLVTLFTVGHTLSLLLANYDVVAVKSEYVEFLIPITILVAVVYNVLTAAKSKEGENAVVLYIVTLFFGLIHGFGFANYYRMISEGNEIAPLLEFALGVEIAQLIVVLVVLFLAFLLQTFLRLNRRDWILVVSSIVIGLVIPMLVATWIF
ncbi:MAG: HupE/UreJ family protein [Flavobacteriales bacterium]|jgi:hypothetical protein|uniref:HupE/UreJ family protein n=1 Tax=Candidatus Ulvibacter alkanivorans TaxID=2267620 RepID=UPI000DF349AF|nr:HupE/UreJ family protein [Candidatus Ulvibacter alkanivorans]MCH2490294.1 HupE/UreJ family protein [Flavobacteriales bacterium]